MKKKQELKLEKLYLNNTKTVGYCCLISGKPERTINLSVEFLEEALELIKKTGCEYVDLSVFENNQPLMLGKEKIGVFVAPRVPKKGKNRYEVY